MKMTQEYVAKELPSKFKFFNVLSFNRRGDKAMVSCVPKNGIALTRHVPVEELKIIREQVGVSGFVKGL